MHYIFSERAYHEIALRLITVFMGCTIVWVGSPTVKCTHFPSSFSKEYIFMIEVPSLTYMLERRGDVPP